MKRVIIHILLAYLALILHFLQFRFAGMAIDPKLELLFEGTISIYVWNDWFTHLGSVSLVFMMVLTCLQLVWPKKYISNSWIALLIAIVLDRTPFAYGVFVEVVGIFFGKENLPENTAFVVILMVITLFYLARVLISKKRTVSNIGYMALLVATPVVIAVFHFGFVQQGVIHNSKLIGDMLAFEYVSGQRSCDLSSNIVHCYNVTENPSLEGLPKVLSENSILRGVMGYSKNAPALKHSWVESEQMINNPEMHYVQFYKDPNRKLIIRVKTIPSEIRQTSALTFNVSLMFFVFSWWSLIMIAIASHNLMRKKKANSSSQGV